MNTETVQTEVVVLGAGVIGLAVSATLSKHHELLLMESHARSGQETSSRNSCVIHSGIYYPRGSRKTDWCIAGRTLLYEYCEKNRVHYRKCGKAVVSTSAEDDVYLEKLESHSRSLNVPCEWRTKSQLEKDVSFLSVRKALFFPETGIIEVHDLLDRCEQQTTSQNGQLLYKYSLKDIGREKHGWQLTFDSPAGTCLVSAKFVVNATGLAAAEWSNRALGVTRYEHRYCRGRYFLLGKRHQNTWPYLVYPTPEQHGAGVHVTLDLEGNCRLGPDVDWCSSSKFSEHEKWYDCDWSSILPAFASRVRHYAPSIQDAELSPGFIGIRPKLFVDGKAHTDFLVENHDGFVHCLGIESPGLTACLAIADEVRKILTNP